MLPFFHRLLPAFAAWFLFPSGARAEGIPGDPFPPLAAAPPPPRRYERKAFAR